MTEKAARTITAAALCLSLAWSLSSCSRPSQDEGPDYADDEAMAIIADGFERRADTIDAMERSGEDTQSNANLKAIVQSELDVIEGLASRRFEDTTLQEHVIAYINTLNESIDLLDTASTGGTTFIEQWNGIRDERSTLLDTFVDDYGLAVEDHYQADLDELTANGAEVAEQNRVEETINQLVSDATFEKHDEGYGGFTYTATIQNGSDIDFGNVGIVLALYDEQNIKVSEAYASTSSWPAGETIRFEAFDTVDAASIKASVSYYDVQG